MPRGGVLISGRGGGYYSINPSYNSAQFEVRLLKTIDGVFGLIQKQPQCSFYLLSGKENMSLMSIVAHQTCVIK